MDPYVIAVAALVIGVFIGAVGFYLIDGDRR